MFVGNLDLQLSNLFRTGKQFHFYWNRFGEQSQELQTNYSHPFIANSDIELSLGFGIQRQDSAFLNQDFNISGSTFVSDHIQLALSFERQNGNVLYQSEDQISSLGALDFIQNWYGLSLTKDVVNPTVFEEFFGFQLLGRMGLREIQRNANLPLMYYDTIDLKSTNGSLHYALSIQKRFGRSSTIFFSQDSETILGKQRVTNQFFRVGGLATLRGFNELFFFTDAYFINTLEYRYFFEEQSYFFAFLDQGVLRTMDEAEWPVGLGTGLSLETNSGVFSFAMALGRTKEIPWDISNAKIHFGYISQF